MMATSKTVVKLPHHEQQELCVTRPAYRQGRKLTAVKVYTVNDESQHLMICGVPKLQLGDEIKRLASPYGDIKKVLVVSEYPTEEFTEAYHVHYARIQSARIAKRFIDGKNFYGGILHVFYAPELESLSETRGKLIQRRRDIAVRIRRNQEDKTDPDTNIFVPKEQYNRKKKTPALPLTEDRLSRTYPGESFATIYHGIPQSIDPRPISEPSLPENWATTQSAGIAATENILSAPYQRTEAILMANDTRRPGPVRSKNYKGRYVGQNRSTRLTRPHIIDTRNIPLKVFIPQVDDTQDKKVFTKVKKVETGIKIKLLPDEDQSRKRIILKNPNTTLVRPNPDLQTSISLAKSQIRKAMQRK